MATPTGDDDGQASTRGPIAFDPFGPRRRAQPSWLRDTKAGRILFVVVVLAVAFGITKGCANRDVEVEQDEAVEIARTQIDFTPNLTQVKFLKQGLRSRSTWFVSFAIREATGVFARCTVVEVSARTGAVGSIREGGRGDC